jgi:hypothetical protein
MNLTVPFIVLFIIFVAVVIGWSETWKKKEHYRCRVFELSKGKEGRTIVTVKPSEPSPTPPEKKDGIATGMYRPLMAEWVECNGEYFRKSYVAHLTKNPNDTINVVLVDGHSINTGIKIDEVRCVLDIFRMPSINEELKRLEK